MAEYNLRGLGTTVTEARIEKFFSSKWGGDLRDIPKIGKETKAALIAVGIKDQLHLLAKFLEFDCELVPCLKFMAETAPAGVHYGMITLLVLAKMQRAIAIPPPPPNWEEMVFPQRKP